MQKRRWKTIYVCGEHRILHIYELDENEILKKKFKRLKHRNLKILNEKLTMKNDPCLIEDSIMSNEAYFQNPEELLLPPASNSSLLSSQSICIEDLSMYTLSNENLPSNSSSPNALDDDTLIDQQKLNSPPEKQLEESINQKDKNESDQLFSHLIEHSGDYDFENDDFFLDQFED